MEKRIKYLILGLKIELFVGILISGFFATMLGTMATASPTSTTWDFVLAATLTFLAFSLVLVLLPFYSIKEIRNFADKGTLTFNYIYIVIFVFLSFYLFPFAVWNIYHLIKLKESSSKK